MLLERAKELLQPFTGTAFGDIFQPEEMVDLKTDKGIVGKLLEKSLGLANTSYTLDFEDGELKTNKCLPNGYPRETMFITQISSKIDDILDREPFEQTVLWNKIKNLLYVPVCKEGSTPQWMFLPPIHVDLTTPDFEDMKDQLEQDYYSIAGQLKKHIETSADGFIHTSNGRLIQIRSKDAQPYHPIYSQRYGRYVSNKNHAFYFKKDFMKALQSLSPYYPFDPHAGFEG